MKNLRGYCKIDAMATTIEEAVHPLETRIELKDGCIFHGRVKT